MVDGGNNIDTIFFDIGGVLIDIHPKKTFKYIGKCIGLSSKDIELSFPINSHEKYEKGEISDRKWYEAVFKSLPVGSNLKEKDFWLAWRLFLGKQTNVIEILRLLKKHYSVWLLSNTNPRHIEDEIKIKYDFPNEIDGAIYSFEVGKMKPDPEIFYVAVNSANTKFENCVFIDDLKSNVDSAKKIGILSFQYVSTNQLIRDLINHGIKVL
tara:strand:+ start:884 stop:1513 length:630 start_codon:yes stop_codon:yes gene_type:complete